MQPIGITTEKINLDQLLKWGGIVETGGQVKLMLTDQLILVNGLLVTERRKQLYLGDIVKIKGLGVWQLVKQAENCHEG